VADGFEAGVGVEFCEDVFDVIIHGGGADVELVRNLASAVAFAKLFTTSTSRDVRRTPF
jgi:hypothetical protein